MGHILKFPMPSSTALIVTAVICVGLPTGLNASALRGGTISHARSPFSKIATAGVYPHVNPHNRYLANTNIFKNGIDQTLAADASNTATSRVGPETLSAVLTPDQLEILQPQPGWANLELLYHQYKTGVLSESDFSFKFRYAVMDVIGQIPQSPTEIAKQEALRQKASHDEAFIREKCDALADKSGLPKDLQDVRLLYPGLDLTFAEFLCGAFAAGIPVHFASNPDDANIVRVQVKFFNLDFMRGHVLDDGTFVGASSPITGGTSALSYAGVTNTQTGEQNTEPAILIVLHQGWSSQMEAYLKQQQ